MIKSCTFKKRVSLSISFAAPLPYSKACVVCDYVYTRSAFNTISGELIFLLKQMQQISYANLKNITKLRRERENYPSCIVMVYGNYTSFLTSCSDSGPGVEFD